MRRVVGVILVSLISPWLHEAACSDSHGNLSVECDGKYAAEGKSLACDCKATSGGPLAGFSLTWPGFSNTSKLEVINVTRADNGTIFTCLIKGKEHTQTINYTLEVAYGPESEHTRIRGPSPFVTNGTKPLTLTCEADDVHPRPLYKWEGVNCHNHNKEKTCVLQPETPWDDGRVVECTVGSPIIKENTGRATYLLNLTYPPSTRPEIRGFTAGQVLKNGDTVQCRVSEGKPLVKRVIFSCSSDPPHEDQEDVTEGSSVLSSLTISSAASAGDSMTCVCSAFWEPEENLYLMNSSIVVFVNSADKDEHLKTTITAASFVFLLLLIVVVFFAVYIRKRELRKDSKTEAQPSCVQSDSPCQKSHISSSHYEEVDKPGPHLKHNAGDIDSRSTCLDPRNRPVRFPYPTTGFTQEETNPFTVKSDEGLYSEIEMPLEQEASTDSRQSVLSTITSRTMSVPEDHETPVFTQSSILPLRLDKIDALTEELEVYDTLQRR